ncbi:MAG: lysylphosphatidylglycerol synthase domain-containing protein [bacterium]|nr:lysylphosphatidylglycerol synthase domain-containing protein [bacterium]
MPVRVFLGTILGIGISLSTLSGLVAWGLGGFGAPFPEALPVALALSIIGAFLIYLFVPAITFSDRYIGRLKDPRTIAFTFDDGPNGTTTLKLLDLLSELNIRATFFLVGKWVESEPEIAREIARRGHQIGNHGYSHRVLTFLSPRKVKEEVTKAQDAIFRITGVRPTLFRAPHGFKSLFLARALKPLGLTPIRWTVGVWDTECPPPKTIADRALRRLRGGGILLLHDGDGDRPRADREPTLQAIRGIAAGLTARGLTPAVPSAVDLPLPGRNRKVILALVGFVLSAILLLFAVREVKWPEFFSLLHSLKWLPLIAALLLNLLVDVIKGYRFGLLLRHSYRVPLPAAVGSIFGGYAINCVLPARAGDLARFVLLEREARVRKRDSAMAYVGERILEGFGIVALGLVALAIFFLTGTLPPSWVIKGMLLVAGLSTLLLAALFWFKRRPPHWFPPAIPGKTLVRLFPLSLLLWILQAWIVALSLQSLNIHLPAYGSILILVVVNLAMMAPAAPAGIGPFEFAMVAGLALFGVPPTMAFSTAIIYHALQVIPVVFIGLPWALVLTAGKAKTVAPGPENPDS